MPHSLRVKIKGLRYKGIITDKDCDRLCKALDNEDVLDKIRDEIKAEMDDIASGCVAKYSYDEGYYSGLRWTLKIIDKYKEQTECTHTQ